MATAGFWEDQVAAQKVISESNKLKQSIQGVVEFTTSLEDVPVMLELAEESGDEGLEYEKELLSSVDELSERIERLEIMAFLGGELDPNPAILTIHAGAGGTESCDWADMLFRLYTRWAERNGFKIEIQDVQTGEEAGISKATIRIDGPYAYGHIKAERGVHRLVRISPFDSNKKRHTSFSSVDVVAEITDEIDIELNDEEIRVDTYRASGKGGQHVNKTDSAVRMTHLPTGIVVTCQNERSQMKNRATAMKTLKSRIYEKRQDEKRTEMEKFYGEKGEIGWGNQIRSYVFQPYQMVKDLRTGTETSNIQEVMDGGIDDFIHSWLRAGGPSSRQNAVVLED